MSNPLRFLGPMIESKAFAASLVLMSCAISAAPTRSVAQDSDEGAPVCLSKTDKTGGTLRFIVDAQDAALFENAGFSEIDCPEDIAGSAVYLANRCARFSGLSAKDKAVIENLYGLSVDQMCAASDAWTSLQESP